MTGYQKNPVSWILPAAMIIGLMMLLFGCESTKHVNRSSKSTAETSSLDIDSLVNKKIDSVSSHYEEEIKKLNNSLDFGENCNTDMMQDIINKLRSALTDTVNRMAQLQEIINRLQALPKEAPKLTYYPDGSFTAIGLKYANLQLMESKKVIDSLRLTIEQEVNLKLKAQDELKTARSEKQVEKETKIMSKWWMWYLAGCLTMIILAIWLKWKHSKKEIINQ